MNHTYGTVFSSESSCVAFGSFDGIHIGHKAVIDKVLEDKDHETVILSINSTDEVIYTESEKSHLLGKTDLSQMISYPEEIWDTMTAEEIIKDILFKQLQAKVVVIGDGYTFGSNNGNIELLRKMGEQFNFTVVEVSTVVYDNKAVSVKMIKEVFENNQFEKAAEILGGPYIMRGRVLHGKAHGRLHGMPTANLGTGKNKLFPPHGVYATLSYFNGDMFKGMTNIGRRPSDDDLPIVTVETFLLDFDDSIYNKDIILEVYLYVRGVVKFNGLAEVKAQVDKDIETVRHFMDSVK